MFLSWSHVTNTFLGCIIAITNCLGGSIEQICTVYLELKFCTMAYQHDKFSEFWNMQRGGQNGVLICKVVDFLVA